MFKTHEVQIGTVKMGGKHPIRIQSMTNTNSLDVESTLSQTIRLSELGCELVRITAPGLQEVESIKQIHEKFRSLGYKTPIVVDVHFNPKVAEAAACFVEKVRINPGNYVDKKQFKNFVYSDKEYSEELNKIANRLMPLIDICKNHGTAIRVGVNHGSLSDRIINKFGNTALGMAMSAFEFAQIFHVNGFSNLVLSLKSSDVKTMVYATRLFVKMMQDHNMSFPIHLGVTEAGAGEDGRIKSAIGIGTLLLNGIGNTIRVSLTEAPEKEIPVAKNILETVSEIISEKGQVSYFNESTYKRRETIAFEKYGGQYPVSIITNFVENEMDGPMFKVDELEVENQEELNKILIVDLNLPDSLEKMNQFVKNRENYSPILVRKEYFETEASEYIIKSSIEFGHLIIDGICDAICIMNKNFSDEFNYELAGNILQACGIRHHKAEIISCPSCGRTQFDIEKLLNEVKASVSHLKGLKIGVMGCVVNGPGEMADADYGLVGAGKDKVWLFKGHQVVLKNINQQDACKTLVEFLKNENRWFEKNQNS